MSKQQDRRALYLRWRPRTFSEVVGQEHVTRTLRNAVRSNRLAHAYLLCGPRGTGKTSLARILYRAANCAEPHDGEPCGRCRTCASAASGQAIDLVEVDAASNRGIDDIRQLRERVAYTPSEGRYRVYIIDEAHELTTPAWDAFLKTLEEPPAHTIFVLATTEAHKVPSTIVSRCQRFDLRRIGYGQIRAQLAQVAEREGMEVEPAVLDTLARMARGGLRDALSLLDQLHAYAGGRLDMSAARAVLGIASADAVRGFVEAVEAADAARAVEALAQVADEGVDLRQFLGEAISHLRGLLLAGSGATDSLSGDFSSDDLEWLRAHAPRWSGERLLGLTRALAEALARVRDPMQLALQVELAVLDTCFPQRSAATPIAEPEPSRLAPPASLPPTRAPASPVTSPGPPAERRASMSEAADSPAGPEVVSTDLQDPTPIIQSPDSSSLQRPTSIDQPSRLTTGAAQVESGEGSALTLDAVRADWPAVMDHLRARSGVVAAYLETAELTKLEAGELRLEFGFPFHQRQVSDLKNRRTVEDALAEVTGHRLQIICAHRPPDAPPLGEQEFAAELERLLAEDPVLRRAVDLWGRNLTIVE